MLSMQRVPCGEQVVMLVNWVDGIRAQNFSFLSVSSSELWGEQPKLPNTSRSFSPAKEETENRTRRQKWRQTLRIRLRRLTHAVSTGPTWQTNLLVFPGCWEGGVDTWLHQSFGFCHRTALVKQGLAYGHSPPSAQMNQSNGKSQFFDHLNFYPAK